MTADTLKITNPSCWADLQYVGLKTAGISAVHSELLSGGKRTVPIDDLQFTGQVLLRVHHGGLRDRNLPSDVKELFRDGIMPVLEASFPEICHQYNGKLELHFREGRLTTFNLTH